MASDSERRPTIIPPPVRSSRNRKRASPPRDDEPALLSIYAAEARTCLRRPGGVPLVGVRRARGKPAGRAKIAKDTVAVKNWRRTAGLLLALLYAVSMLIPASAAAAQLPGQSPPCHSHAAVQGMPAHVQHHAQGLAHDHNPASRQTPAHDHAQDQACCASFGGIAVIPPAMADIALEQGDAQPLAPLAEFVLHGQSPAPVDRPPRVLLPA